MKLAATQIALGILIIITGIVLSIGYLPGIFQDQTILPSYTFTIPSSRVFVSGDTGLPVSGDTITVTFRGDLNLPGYFDVVDFHIKEKSAPLFYGCLGASFLLGMAVLGCGIAQFRKARRKTFQTIDY